MATIYQNGIQYSGSGEPLIYDDMGGATSTTGGVHGLVPAPSAGDNEKFLSGDGSWKSAGEYITKTVEGNPIEFTDGADAPLVKCVTEIQGSQDLHGYDKPWVGGAGKNKAILTVASVKANNIAGTWSGNTYTINGVTFNIDVDSDGNIIGITVSGTASATVAFEMALDISANESYIISGCPSGGNNSKYRLDYPYSSDYSQYAIDYGSGTSAFTNLSTTHKMRIVVFNGHAFTNALTFHPMIRLSTVTDSTFTPYSNICPITAYTEGEIEVSDGDGNTTTHTTTYPSAIYRGSEDCVEGEVSYDMQVIDLGDLTWVKSSTISGTFYATLPDYKFVSNVVMLSSAYNYIGSTGTGTPALVNKPDGSFMAYYLAGTVYRELYFKDTRFTQAADFANAVVGVQLAYELATPTTSSVTPTNLPIKSLSGYNHIESSTGDMEIEYITESEQAIIDLIPEGLPEVTSSDEGKVATVDSSGKWVADTPSGGGHTYSTTAQVVGTWIDGSDIYEVVWHNEFDFWTIPASTASTNFLTISSPQLPYGCVIISAVAIHGVTSHGAGGGTQISPVAITCPNSNSNCDVRQFLTFDFNAKDIIIQYIIPS